VLCSNQLSYITEQPKIIAFLGLYVKLDARRGRRQGGSSIDTPRIKEATMETQDSIHEFWFGAGTDDDAAAKEKSRLWWSKDAGIDRAVRQRFEDVLKRAARSELDDWSATPAGTLALILLTDQFPRNMYRDTPQGFAFDALARDWCRSGIDRGFDQALRPIERVFFYMPLEHSESLHDQYLAVALFEKMIAALEPERQSGFTGYLDFALHHRDIIERFGRFPHRNAILGRESSEQESAFLLEKGSSF
jgi:uncharacterized protein (DUF924 family)